MFSSRWRVRALVATMASAAAGITAASASAATAATSNNWSGYVASGKTFSSVAGSWVQPTVTCNGGSTYSAYWVGLGGTSGQGGALEQTGTQADCSSDGQPHYFAWYELVPAGPVNLDLSVNPGDRMSARVSVNGTAVTLSLTDDTTGAAVTKNVQMSNPDTSSADWIAEAPSACDQSGGCSQLPLADFGTVSFTNATATAGGHTGPIADPDWTSQPVALSGGASDPSLGTPVADQSSGAAGAEPSALSSDGSSFSVTSQSSNATPAAPDGYSGQGYAYAWGDGYVYLYGQ
jgi:Peptidase A4 family